MIALDWWTESAYLKCSRACDSCVMISSAIIHRYEAIITDSWI